MLPFFFLLVLYYHKLSAGMNIPMYGAVKRCTPLVNLILAVVILRRPFPSVMLITSILIITAGCFVAGTFVCFSVVHTHYHHFNVLVWKRMHAI